jgi:hypothetical protein
VVVLEDDRAAVVAPGVGLDDEALGTLEEVDFPPPELDVDLRWRDAVSGAELEEERLEVRARAVGLDAVEAQPHELGLAPGAAVEARGDGALEVGDGAGDGGDGDAFAVGGVGGRASSSSPSSAWQAGRRRGGPCERGTAVDVDAVPKPSAGGGWDRDMDGAVDWIEEPPKDGRGAVAEDSSLTAGEDGRHETPMKTEASVSYGVDALVDAVELPPSCTISNSTSTQASAFELTPRRHPMLSRGDPRHPGIWCVAFMTHVGT